MFKYSSVMGCRYVVTVLARPVEEAQWQSNTEREEFTGQQGSQLRFYGKIYTLCDFYKRGEEGWGIR